MIQSSVFLICYIIIKMKKIRLAIFDMDGTLVDTENHMWFVTEKNGFLRLGYEVDDDFLISFRGRTNQSISNIILERYKDIDIEAYWKIVYEENYAFLENNSIPIMEGAFELLEFLKANNITCSVATSTPKKMAYLTLTNTKLLPYFDFILTGDMITKGKPDPEIYLKSLEHYGIENNEAIVFEDASAGARSAINAHIPLFYVPNGGARLKEDEEDAFVVLNNLKEAIDVIKTNFL